MRQIYFCLVLSAVLFVFCLPTHAQQTGKVPRIGYLDPSTASGSAGPLEAFWQELRKLGWIEGKNITIEYRFAEQKPDRLPELTADLVRLKVDLIVVAGTPSALAAKNATANIPVVMATAADAVGEGLIASLGRPGGNVTGLVSLGPELNTKKAGDTEGCGPQAGPSWSSAVPGRRKPPTERAQGGGAGIEAKVRRDRHSTPTPKV